MGYTFDYDVEITLVPDEGVKITDEYVVDAVAALRKIQGLGAPSGWRTPDGISAYFSVGTEEAPTSDYDTWAEKITKQIFLALGPCNVDWSWYRRERDPDDTTFFCAEEDYERMLAPLERLATAGKQIPSDDVEQA